MPPTRRRRIVRRAVMALAVVVLLPVAYVATTITVAFAAGVGWVPMPAKDALSAYVDPCRSYIAAGYPGGEMLNDVLLWAYDAGRRLRQE